MRNCKFYIYINFTRAPYYKKNTGNPGELISDFAKFWSHSNFIFPHYIAKESSRTNPFCFLYFLKFFISLIFFKFSLINMLETRVFPISLKWRRLCLGENDTHRN